jgi:hypothetical protein
MYFPFTMDYLSSGVACVYLLSIGMLYKAMFISLLGLSSEIIGARFSPARCSNTNLLHAFLR